MYVCMCVRMYLEIIVSYLQNGQTHSIHYFNGALCHVDVPYPGNQVEWEAATEHGHEPLRGEHGRVHPFILQVRPKRTCFAEVSDRTIIAKCMYVQYVWLYECVQMYPLYVFIYIYVCYLNRSIQWL